MKTKLTAASSALLMLGAGYLSSPSAFADLQISQTTVIDAPGMKSMLGEIPTDKRAPLLGMMSQMMTGKPWVTTTWLKGNRLRTDMGETTTVVNAADGKEFTLNNITKIYSIGAYDPFQKAAGTFACTIAPTGQTSTMLGHTIDRYSVSMASSVLPKSPIIGEIWAAPDMPTPPAPTYAAGVAADFGAQMSKVKGMPLAFKLIYQNTPAGTITVTSYATAINSQTLPETAFRIPAGYSEGKTRLATQNPTTGYPLGDGMPLDSLGAVTDDMATGQQSQDAFAAGDSGGLQSLLGAMGGGGAVSGGTGAALNGMSPQMLQGLLGALGGSSAGSALSGSSSGLGGGSLSPQLMQELQSAMSSMLNGGVDGE